MYRRRVGIAAPIVAASLYFSGSAAAYAYLDPGTGSIMLQIILGGVAGLVVAVKLYWGRILGFFGSIFKRNRAPGSVASREPEVIESVASREPELTGQGREPGGYDK